MTVLFAGDIGMDTTLSVGHVPDADEKVVADAAADHAGGVVANAAYAALLAGAASRLVCAVGEDAAGRDAVAQLRAAGVEVAAAPVAGPTCRALILVDAAGEKRLVLVPGATMYPPADAVRAARPAAASWVHTAAYDLPGAAALAAACRAARVPWSVDLEPATLPADRASLAPVLAGAAAVLCNRRAAEALGGDAADWLIGLGVRTVLLTLGADGVRAVGPSSALDVRPPAGAPRAVDTTGAGDCLAGWFAARTAAGDGLAQALAEAVTAATLSCARPGAQTSYPARADVLASGLVPPHTAGATPPPTRRGTP
ncbi:carbohydrate kinase family protein [Streptomyces sp. NPDC047002]|uniref:carbohydrate kinase family protein n=1 Tax=Streptomyces sp. NPDC047002 TaxID=3155475 RepID=UPI003451B06A